ncbi:unnamed protein product [marine sediment metagenome]|uniref:Uncharacterized protein n=1 Tax=marine sediment metagenome TaxID=412755 RepID=X1F2F6_9ZZZZ
MPGYKVQDTREIKAITPAGSEQLVYRVWLVTDRGATGTVDVPQDKWNKKDLPSILKAKADDLDLAFAVTE